MANKVNRVSDLTYQRIKQKSVTPLPDNPSKQIGLTANKLKELFAGIVTDKSYSALSEINRVVDEINKIFEGQFVARWHSGTFIENNAENIIVDENLFEKSVNVGDLFLNSVNGNIYICMTIEDENTYWNFLLNIKGMGFESDPNETVIDHTLEQDTDKTFKNENITNISITIPEDVSHGFCSGVNFISGEVAPSVNFTNNSIYPLKLIQYGLKLDNYSPLKNRTVAMSFYCDGINVYCYINEV